jgi:hypothetical protein
MEEQVFPMRAADKRAEKKALADGCVSTESGRGHCLYLP